MTWLTLLKDTFRAPDRTFRSVVDLNLPPRVGWQALALTVILSVIFSTGGLLLMPTELPAYMEFMRHPLQNLFVQALFNVLFAVILSKYLRLFGGTNTTSEIVLAIAWVQGIMLLLLMLQLLVPPVAALIGLVGFVVYPWLLTRFATESAGFTQPFGTFLLIFSALFTAALATSIMMLSTGIVRPEDVSNV